ncbi:type IV pilus modification protein PilV [Chitinolyticbacter meiyuanensis]|uniref:type IV pilus modification protein PilV n=1 Tax=Chitinolyticbacter meiyuanensis TaxID=682798 RepID=UPI0011E5DA8C|nr:type IV pilus modification protein PilV [Chitinolyticbacter meiyuanensis]
MHKTSGIILIEVLVSLAILAIGILGLASLQVYSLKSGQSAYWRSVASDLANDMADRIRANRSPKQNIGEGNAPATDEENKPIPFAPDYGRLSCSENAGAISCNWMSGYTVPNGTAGSDLAKDDLENWMQLVKTSLPVGTNGGAIICRDNDLTDDPGSGGQPILNPAANDFVTKTGCLATNAALYATAPYVIKVWWQEQEISSGNGGLSSGVLQYFATPI